MFLLFEDKKQIYMDGYRSREMSPLPSDADIAGKGSKKNIEISPWSRETSPFFSKQAKVIEVFPWIRKTCFPNDGKEQNLKAIWCESVIYSFHGSEKHVFQTMVRNKI